jgi:general secretion pathway protein I
MKYSIGRPASGFTLLEVMIAIAFIGIALIALLSLHHTDMVSVMRGRDLTRAAMLAQSLMSEAEMEGFPNAGTTSGNFETMYHGQYPNFRWRQQVDPSAAFPDVRRVRITVLYGPGFQRSFELTEFIHNPAPQVNTPGDSSGSDQSGPVPLGGPGGSQP